MRKILRIGERLVKRTEDRVGMIVILKKWKGDADEPASPVPVYKPVCCCFTTVYS